MIDEIIKENIIDRTFYTSRIQKYLWSPVIKVLVWQRRVWKSYILKGIIKHLVQTNKMSKDNIFYINKELPVFDNVKNYEDLKDKFSTFKEGKSSGKIFIGIDEVQEITGWEKFINWLLAEYGENIEIFITGSNSSLLSSELATYISGRYIEFHILSLSFDEFCTFKNNAAHTQANFLEYLKYGWLPGIFRMQWDDETIFHYLRWVYNTIVLKDIISHNNIKNTNFFEELYKFSLSNIGSVFSAKSISDYLKSQKIKISVDSVLNYLKYAEDSFLLNKIYSVSPETKKIFEIYNKYYVGDIWLRNSLVWFDLKKDIGKLMENYAFLELKRHWYAIRIGRLSSWKEIDFIAEKNGITKYFQVCYLLSGEETIKREYSSLEEVRDNWEKYVVSFDEINFWVSGWIKHLNIMHMSEVL